MKLTQSLVGSRWETRALGKMQTISTFPRTTAQSVAVSCFLTVSWIEFELDNNSKENKLSIVPFFNVSLLGKLTFLNIPNHSQCLTFALIMIATKKKFVERFFQERKLIIIISQTHTKTHTNQSDEPRH